MQQNQLIIPQTDLSQIAQNVAAVVTILRMFNPDKIVDFRMKCKKCEKLLLEPLQASCGCRYCRQCIIDHLKNNNKCYDIECDEITSIHTDRAIIREISELQDFCPYPECEFSNKILDLNEHIKNCYKGPIICGKCKSLIFKSNEENHLKESCSMMEIECINCNRLICRKLMNEHLDSNNIQVCSDLISKCPNKCCEELVKVSAHRQICIKELKECPYICTFKGTRIELNEHMFDKAKEHIQSIIYDMEQKMTQLEENILNQTHQSIANLCREISNLKSSIMYQTNGTIPTAPLEIIYPICPYVWELTQFPTKLALAKSSPDGKLHYISPSFYLFKEGYCAFLKIYPNGDGTGKGKFLSVFFALCKGIYDDGLIWPFTDKISLKITPGYGKWNEGIGGTFKGDAAQSSFQKPKSKMNLGSGCPNLIKIDKVLSDYLINESIFIEIRN